LAKVFAMHHISMGGRCGRTITWFTCIVLLAGCASSSSTKQKSATGLKGGKESKVAAKVQPASVTGEWEGAFATPPYVMRVKLKMASLSGSSLSGSMQIDRKGMDSRPSAQAAEQLQFQGQFDPYTRAISIVPTSTDRSGQDLWPRGSAFVGLLDAEHETISGQLTQPTTFNGGDLIWMTVMRPGEAHRVIDPMVAGLQPLHGAGIFAKAPSDGDLVKWASKVDTEYPTVDLNHVYIPQLCAIMVKLAEDDRFKACFGKTYDKMSPAERAAVAKKLTGPSVFEHPLFKSSRDSRLDRYRALSIAFGEGVMDTAAVVSSGVNAQRTIQHWNQVMGQRLATMPVDVDSFERIRQIESTGTKHAIALWPSDQKAFADRIQQSRQRIAGPVLLKRTQLVVADAKGYAGLQRLSRWESDNQELISYASATDRSQAQGMIDARFDGILKSLMSAEAQRMNFSAGTPRLVITVENDWYLGFAGRYRYVLARKQCQEVVGRLRSRRGSDLQSVQSDLVAVINRSTAKEDVDQFIGSILLVPGDTETPAGIAIVQAGEARKAEIQREQDRGIRLVISGIAGLWLQSVKSDADKNGDQITASIATALRDQTFEYSLTQALPKASESEVHQLRQLFSLALDGELSVQGLARAQQVEKIEAEIRKILPDFTGADVAASVIVDQMLSGGQSKSKD
jgi:hypothetical protein